MPSYSGMVDGGVSSLGFGMDLRGNSMSREATPKRHRHRHGMRHQSLDGGRPWQGGPICGSLRPALQHEHEQVPCVPPPPPLPVSSIGAPIEVFSPRSLNPTFDDDARDVQTDTEAWAPARGSATLCMAMVKTDGKASEESRCHRCGQRDGSYFDHSCPKCNAIVCLACLDDFRLILHSFRCPRCGEMEKNQESLKKEIWSINAYRTARRAFTSLGSAFTHLFQRDGVSTSSASRLADQPPATPRHWESPKPTQTMTERDTTPCDITPRESNPCDNPHSVPPLSTSGTSANWGEATACSSTDLGPHMQAVATASRREPEHLTWQPHSGAQGLSPELAGLRKPTDGEVSCVFWQNMFQFPKPTPEGLLAAVSANSQMGTGQLRTPMTPGRIEIPPMVATPTWQPPASMSTQTNVAQQLPGTRPGEGGAFWTSI